MAFVLATPTACNPPAPAKQATESTSNGSARKPNARRNFLKFTLATSVSLCLSRTDATESVSSKWQQQDLCKHCAGSGSQACSLCTGTGILVIDDSVVIEQQNVCPNCSGRGSIRCPACIGLGLADVSGILRNGARDGTLRMLRNGDYEILECSAFPSCDIYNAPRRSQS